jgi:hypothetical protein
MHIFVLYLCAITILNINVYLILMFFSLMLRKKISILCEKRVATKAKLSYVFTGVIVGLCQTIVLWGYVRLLYCGDMSDYCIVEVCLTIVLWRYARLLYCGVMSDYCIMGS